MDLIGQIDTDHPEISERQSKINSSRGNRKRHLHIVSNQSTKMFPHDFFENETKKLPQERRVKDLDIEDDEELLSLLEKKEKNVTMVTHVNKNIFNLKCTGFEMIPEEEDDERMKTYYESFKKPLGEIGHIKNRNSINFRKSSIESIKEAIEETILVADTNSKALPLPLPLPLPLLENIEKKSRDIFSSEAKYRIASESRSSIKLIANSNVNINMKVREESKRPNPKVANEAVKCKKIENNIVSQSNTNFKDSNNFFDFSSKFSKYNTNITDRAERMERPDSTENADIFSPKNKLPCELPTSNKQTDLNTDMRSKSNRVRRIQSFTTEFENKLQRKPQTPPEVTVHSTLKTNTKLPALKTNRKPQIDIKNIIEAADGYKEDPIIKKKLDDIMQNIVDIRNVLDQKTKTRVKIASAPTNLVFNSRIELNPVSYENKVGEAFNKVTNKVNSANLNRKLNLNLNSNIQNKDKTSPFIPKFKEKLPVKLIGV